MNHRSRLLEPTCCREEYLQSEGFVIQVVCVGGNSYGNAVLSGVVSQREP